VSVQKVLLCPFHCKPTPSGVNLETLGLENIPQVPGHRAEVCQNHDAREAVLATLSVLKWSGPIFRPRSSKPTVRSFYPCPFHCKPRPSGVNLESPGLENIPQFRGNTAKNAQNQDARKAVLATLSFLKWSGAIFRPRSSKVSVEKVFLCPFHCKPSPSGNSLDSLGLENIPHVPGNQGEVGQNHESRKVVSATLSVLKQSGAIFRPRSSKPSVRSFYLCPFHCKPRPSGVSLESPGLENILQVSGNPAELGQNHDARKAVSATLSVLKWIGAIFRPRSSKPSIQKVLLCPFHCKPRPSGVSLESPGLENNPQVLQNRGEDGQNHDARKAVSATLWVLKWSRAIFRPRTSKPSIQEVLQCPFHCKPRPSGVSLESPGLENIL